MHQLLDFIVRKRHWFLFVFLEIIALGLVYRNTTYQRSVLISSANVVTGYVSSVSGGVTSYLNLREINKELTEKNGELEMQVLALRDQLEWIRANEESFKGFIPDSAEQFPYDFIMAKVVNNSVSHLSNYITINKGKKDGVYPDMGVVSERGVVGIVSQADEHFAVVLPLLNPKFRLSCKLLKSNFFGSLGWNGRNARFAQLEELPRHVEFAIGDTIVTSGYSAMFPAGIVVGKVADFKRQHDDNFYTLEVELSADFQALDNVRVMINRNQEEQLRVEKEGHK